MASPSSRTGWSHYRLAGVENDQAILVRTGDTGRQIRCSRKPPGSFVRVTARPLSFRRRAALTLAKALFKAPELTARIVLVDHRRWNVRSRFRAYRSQLERGVYMHPETIVHVLRDAELPLARRSKFTHLISALLLRDPGYRNLPVVPKEAPLDVEFCNVVEH